MQYEGEHLWIGTLGHVFVVIAFTASLLSTIAYVIAGKKNKTVSNKKTSKQVIHGQSFK